MGQVTLRRFESRMRRKKDAFERISVTGINGAQSLSLKLLPGTSFILNLDLLARYF